MLEPQHEQWDLPAGQGGGKKGRTGIVLPAAAIASVVVAAVTIVSYLVSPDGSGANSLALAINALPRSHSIALLEQERQEIIVMNQAASAMTEAAKPARVTPADITAAGGKGSNQSSGQSGSASGSGGSGSSSSSSSTSQPTATGPGFEATPAEAQTIAQQLMPSFGFSVSSQWSCLEKLWTQESSWQWDAQNASGAYGIPQSLPASKMASVASDYLTNATTQIKWGLGYIQSVYGTPCNAWGHEVADGFY